MFVGDEAASGDRALRATGAATLRAIGRPEGPDAWSVGEAYLEAVEDAGNTAESLVMGDLMRLGLSVGVRLLAGLTFDVALDGPLGVLCEEELGDAEANGEAGESMRDSERFTRALSVVGVPACVLLFLDLGTLPGLLLTGWGIRGCSVRRFTSCAAPLEVIQRGQVDELNETTTRWRHQSTRNSSLQNGLLVPSCKHLLNGLQPDLSP